MRAFKTLSHSTNALALIAVSTSGNALAVDGSTTEVHRLGDD